MVKVAEAYGVSASRMAQTTQFAAIREVLDSPGPALCDVRLDPSQEFEPRLKSRRLADGSIATPALEDMYPFLEPDELNANLLVEEFVP
jgi:acetolactate synthase-1/2/3 large subunit